MTQIVTGVGACLPFELAGLSPAEAARSVASACTPGWFDVTTRLGRRGYKYLPLPSQLAVAAGRDLGEPDPAVPAEDRTLWMGSASAASRIHAPLDATIRATGSDDISPASAPFFSVNLVAGRLSADLLARGGATTFTTPSTAALDAMAAADAALRLGRCSVAVVSAVEVPAADGEPGLDGAEFGAVAFATTSAQTRAGDRALAEISVRRGFWTPASLTTDLAQIVLDIAGEGRQVPDVCLCAGPDVLARLEDAGSLRRIAAEAGAEVTVVAASSGSLAASAAVGAAALGSSPHVVVVAGFLGHLAASLIRPTTAAGGSL